MARVHGLYLVSEYRSTYAISSVLLTNAPHPSVIGCVFTGLAPLLFAVIDVNATYWGYGFVASILSVFGSD